MNNQKAMVLLSGGLDSTTVLAIARHEGYDVVARSFSYGQRHNVELQRARELATATAVPWRVIELSAISGSALTGHGEVPKDRSDEEMGSGIPDTYVPLRNTEFLVKACQEAEVLEIDHIFIGVNALDYSGYPDCRPVFIERFQALAEVFSKRAVEGDPPHIHAPLMYLTKADIIARGFIGVDYSRTLSCYDPVGDLACGRCDACKIRLAGFAENGTSDPAAYVEARAA